MSPMNGRRWRYSPIASEEEEEEEDGDFRMSSRLLVAAVAFVAATSFLSVVARPSSSSSQTMTEETTVTYSHDRQRAAQVDIVHIVLDDVGENDLWSSTDLNRTEVSPRMTGLARHGLTLTNYHGQSYCTPARAAMLTGKFTHKLGFSGEDARGGPVEIKALTNFSVPLGHRLLPEFLSRMGYSTHGIGKWNIGHCNELYLPWKRGFDTFLGYFSSGIDYVTHEADTVVTSSDVLGSLDIGNASFALKDLQYYDPEVESFRYDSAAMQFEGQYTTTMFGEEAARRIDEAAERRATGEDEKPLFVWLAFHGMHGDSGVDDVPGGGGSQTFDNLASKGEKLAATRRSFAVGLREIDAAVGSVEDALDRLFTLSNKPYLIVLHSDNGADPCATNCAGSNSPLRGLKFFDFDGALRIPAFVYSPALLATNRDFATYDKLMHHVDWLATFGAAAGMDVDALLSSDDYDSLNHWPSLLAAAADKDDGDMYSPRSQVLFSIDSETATLRNRSLKLLFNRSWADYYSANTSPFHCLKSSDDNFLFDIEQDPKESNNLWDDPSYLEARNQLVDLARSKYDSEYFHYSQQDFSNSLTTHLLNVLLNSTNSSTAKILVPWDCSVVRR